MNIPHTIQIDCDVLISELIEQWINGNKNDVIQQLASDHAGLTAKVIYCGSLDGSLKLSDILEITNRLGDIRYDLAQAGLKNLPKTFHIRCGDGNDGEYRIGEIEAVDAFDALRKACKTRMINKPKDVTYASFDGDDQNCHAASYVKPIYGDACRWTASASLCESA